MGAPPRGVQTLMCAELRFLGTGGETGSQGQIDNQGK